MVIPPVHFISIFFLGLSSCFLMGGEDRVLKEKKASYIIPGKPPCREESGMSRLISVGSKEEIFPRYQDTPIGLLLEYQNLGRELERYDKAQLLMGLCMDNRKRLSPHSSRGVENTIYLSDIII